MVGLVNGVNGRLAQNHVEMVRGHVIGIAVIQSRSLEVKIVSAFLRI